MIIWDIKQTAEFLNYKHSHIRKLANDGCIPACKVGGEWRFCKESLETFIHEQMMNNCKKEAIEIPYVSVRRKQLKK